MKKRSQSGSDLDRTSDVTVVSICDSLRRRLRLRRNTSATPSSNWDRGRTRCRGPSLTIPPRRVCQISDHIRRKGPSKLRVIQPLLVLRQCVTPTHTLIPAMICGQVHQHLHRIKASPRNRPKRNLLYLRLSPQKKKHSTPECPETSHRIPAFLRIASNPASSNTLPTMVPPIAPCNPAWLFKHLPNCREETAEGHITHHVRPIDHGLKPPLSTPRSIRVDGAD